MEGRVAQESVGSGISCLAPSGTARAAWGSVSRPQPGRALRDFACQDTGLRVEASCCDVAIPSARVYRSAGKLSIRVLNIEPRRPCSYWFLKIKEKNILKSDSEGCPSYE